MRRSLCVILLCTPVIVCSQVHLCASSGIHSPREGHLSDLWKAGLELGLSADVRLSEGLYLRGAIRQSWHTFRGDSAKATTFRGPNPMLFLEEYSPHPPSDVTTTYDIIAQLEHHTQVTSLLVLALAGGLSCSIEKYGDVRVGAMGSWDLTSFPPALLRSWTLRWHFEPRVFVVGVFSMGLRYDILSSIGVMLRADYYTTFRDVSKLSFVGGITVCPNG